MEENGLVYVFNVSAILFFYHRFSHKSFYLKQLNLIDFLEK